jgi:hypothetical protein
MIKLECRRLAGVAICLNRCQETMTNFGMPGQVCDKCCTRWLGFGELVEVTCGYFRNRSPIACVITARPTSEMDCVSGMSLGQISTQFCAYPHS